MRVSWISTDIFSRMAVSSWRIVRPRPSSGWARDRYTRDDTLALPGSAPPGPETVKKNNTRKKAVVCRYFEVPLNNILKLKENRNAKYNHSQLQCEDSLNKRGRKQVKMYQLKIQWQEPAFISLSWSLCSTTPGERMASIYQYWGTGEG